ncbi:MAG: hypothetical protein JKX73_08110 [Flavobacteriales bacterium]|nr:hypothetical protein [Flavobacteriales bacterium]
MRLVFSLVLLLCHGLCFSVTNFYTVSNSGNDIIVGDSLSLSDPQYSNFQAGLFRYKSLKSRIFLEVREEDRILLDSNWVASVELLVSYTDTSGYSTVNVPVKLRVDFKEGITHYSRKAAFQVTNAYSIKYKITQISDSTLLRFLRLGLEIKVERFHSFDHSTSVSNLTHSYNLIKNRLDISWSPHTGAEHYEVSWFWVDNYSPNGKLKLPLEITTSFKNNGSRIITEYENYGIPIIYDRGYVVYRVRPIGISGPDFTDLIRGQWTIPSHNETFKLSQTGFKFRINYGHEIWLNYESSATFNSQGHRSSMIAYADGIFKSRQTIKSLNHEDRSLVSEVIYDFNGRPAIYVLPSPGSISLRYHKSFNLNLSLDNYSAIDFDQDTTFSGLQPAPFSKTSGSSNYYSSSNPNENKHQGFLPRANSYPIAQTTFTNDNTGRISASGSSGVELQIGSGHEVKYSYSKPFQVELDRLFGNDIGYAGQYNKTITTDPNGVHKVTYTDPSGKLVASALASSDPDNLLPVDLDIDTISASLLDNNDWDMTEYEKTSAQPLVVVDSSLNIFEFKVHTPQFVYTCDTNLLCYNVNYSIYLSVLNGEGLEMIPAGPIEFSL